MGTKVGNASTAAASRSKQRIGDAAGNGSAGPEEEILPTLLDALLALKRGDLGVRVSGRHEGLAGEIAAAFNQCAEQLSSFADEVTRVAWEVGTEGKLGGQARVRGAAGTWKDLTDNVNSMAFNLTAQVRNIAQVATAVARGDLSQKVTVDVRGEILELKDTINTMVDQLSSFADEVTRVAGEVGTEGKLGGQAHVKGVSGTWKDLTDNVNRMASNLTSQVRDIAHVTTAVARGDLSSKIAVDVRGEMLQLKNTINTMVDRLRSFADEVTRVAWEVGTEGKLGGQAQVPGVAGTWKDLTLSVNSMAANLTDQVRNIAQVTTAVARGDLSQKITVDVEGEIHELKMTINTMVDQLRAFADEVTRVAREVGTEGRLGGQASVPGVSGTWKDLTDSVNFMASNLTSQVRNIAQVATAVAGGDLSQKITVGAKGEILELKNTANTMVDQLSSFADEVTRVAREVGTEGKLGGQAEVAGVSGTWRDLTERVNQLAQNLTTQVRAIANVATAVTQGDLTRTIDVEAQGEVAELKDNINKMIRNLRETTRKNAEQDWLKGNLARISAMMQGQRDLRELSRLVMSEVTPVVSAQHGAFFMAEGEGDDLTLRLIASYAAPARGGGTERFRLGEGLVGQSGLERRPILISDPPADYLPISSGLGEGQPAAILLLPVVFEGQVLAVVELASFFPFSDVSMMFLEQLVETIGVLLNGIIANMRREELLAESQRLARELQTQSKELQTGQETLRATNIELEEKARQLAEQNRDIEQKNREIGIARTRLEEKARQLALASQYKSEFLANMSHELRTPLNSLMVLSQLLASNPDGNLSPRQVEFANTIYAAGRDLLDLIDDILDLTKVETGRLDVSPANVAVEDVRESIEQSFRPLAEQKGLWLTVTLGAECPPAIVTDGQRLQQILNNLLSNAIKFTTAGGVTVRIDRAPEGMVYRSPQLVSTDSVVAFRVSDTGIGIPPDKLEVIFEAFRQADGTTSRRFGGTGLGLSISREIARLLGAEITLESTVDEGSTFSVYLPVRYVRPEPFGDELLQGSLDAADHRELGSMVVAARSAEDGGRPDLAPMAPSVPELLPLRARRILVVDDDVRNVFAITKALELQGIEVLSAESGPEALDMLLRTPDVDAVLMDIMMPGLDGYQTIEAIRRTPRFAALPIIALTAKAMKGDRDYSLAAGATDYIAKPVEIGELLAKIQCSIAEPNGIA